MQLYPILKYTKLSLKLSLKLSILVLISVNFQYVFINSNSTTFYDNFDLIKPKLLLDQIYFSLPTQKGRDSISIFERDDPYNITLRINLTQGEQFIIEYRDERYELFRKKGNSTQENNYNIIAFWITIDLESLQVPIAGFYIIDVGEKVEAVAPQNPFMFLLIIEYLPLVIIIVIIGLFIIRAYLKFIKNRQRSNK